MASFSIPIGEYLMKECDKLIAHYAQEGNAQEVEHWKETRDKVEAKLLVSRINQWLADRDNARDRSGEHNPCCEIRNCVRFPS